MSDKSLGLKMLWWAEIVVCARAILFFIPVLINKVPQGFSFLNPGDYFTMLVVVSCVLYLGGGISALLGYKRWRLFHILAAAFVILLTAGLQGTAARTQGIFPAAYFAPAVLGIMAAAGACLMRCR